MPNVCANAYKKIFKITHKLPLLLVWKLFFAPQCHTCCPIARDAPSFCYWPYIRQCPLTIFLHFQMWMNRKRQTQWQHRAHRGSNSALMYYTVLVPPYINCMKKTFDFCIPYPIAVF